MSAGDASVTIATTGHGNLPAAAFLSVLQQHGVRHIVDVRSHPASRRFPWFGHDQLETGLRAAGIRYHWLGRDLGGKRRQQSLDRQHHPCLSPGLAAFARHMETHRFAAACRWLVEQGRHDSAALLCAELDPAHCHRWLIADFLVRVHDVAVDHCLASGERSPHRPSSSARLTERNVLRYDRFTTVELWRET